MLDLSEVVIDSKVMSFPSQAMRDQVVVLRMNTSQRISETNYNWDYWFNVIPNWLAGFANLQVVHIMTDDESDWKAVETILYSLCLSEYHKLLCITSPFSIPWVRDEASEVIFFRRNQQHTKLKFVNRESAKPRKLYGPRDVSQCDFEKIGINPTKQCEIYGLKNGEWDSSNKMTENINLLEYGQINK